ncbi:MAG: hypothetical protein GWP04_08285 [Gammaproteobacteria bacterium]|nr:hypothetical protein [Gammaproteobacteria bacterium]
MTEQYRAFPPGRGHLKIPVSSRRAARAGLAMYAPCRPKGVLARWVAWRIVGVLGAGALPGHPTTWKPPMSEAMWAALVTEWADVAGRFDGVAVHERLQASRSGFAVMLLKEGDPLAFVKVREGDGTSIDNEFRALGAVANHEPGAFVVPRPVTTGEVGGWHYLMTSSLAPELHRMPVHPPLGRVLEDVRNGLSSLGRPTDTPAHWEPMHGDFTPWNLRECRGGSLFLIDWEDAGWAPPGADEVLYRAVEAMLTGKHRVDAGSREARTFWVERLRGRQVATADDQDAGVVEALLGLLDD